MISNVIKEVLGIECCALMGANLAGEVAQEQFCETTIGKLVLYWQISFKRFKT